MKRCAWICLIPCLFLAGCDVFDKTNNGPEYETEFWMTNASGMTSTRFSIGEDITFHWRFANVSDKEIVWNQPGTFPYVNFYVYINGPAGEIYVGKTWPNGDYPPPREMKLPPGYVLYFEIKWSDDPSHTPLPAGSYKIVAIEMINLPYLGEPRNLVETIEIE